MAEMSASRPPAPVFEMHGIRKSFAATLAVDTIDLSVAAGEVCALVGQNGAGKSTLMSILAGALAPDAGTMLLGGKPYRPRHPLDARRSGVAMIHQELSLAPHLSVMENIVLGVEPTRRGLVRWSTLRETARAALERLQRRDIPLDVPVGHLSVAAQQIVEIARAVALGSQVLVMDEPTSSLSRQDTEHLFGVIAQLKQEGHAIVYISHFIEEVRDVADRVVVLRDGRIVGELPPQAAASEIVRLMVGRDVEDLYPRSPRQIEEAILEVDVFGPSSATFSLRRGEILGIAGLLGAGRTRLLRSIFGLEHVKTGRVKVGAWIGRLSPTLQLAHGVGMLSEDRKGEGLATTLSVADNLTMSRMNGLGPGAIVLPSRQDAVTRTWVERLAIKCRGPRQAAGELSGGNQQKVALARLLHHDVDVLLLDEPTRGIDVGSKAQLYALLDALVAGKAGRRRAILLVSSYLPELLGLCDRIAVMRRGHLAPARPAAELSEHQLMMDATGAEHAA
jgi:ribose transport system ATP-binding protein